MKIHVICLHIWGWEGNPKHLFKKSPFQSYVFKDFDLNLSFQSLMSFKSLSQEFCLKYKKQSCRGRIWELKK